MGFTILYSSRKTCHFEAPGELRNLVFSAEGWIRLWRKNYEISQSSLWDSFEMTSLESKK